MTSKVDPASVYGDFSSLEKLKGSAKRDDATAVRQVAQQFESVFARMMIKSMRDAIGKDPIFGSDQAELYQGMFDDQLSLELTRGKGLGLADMLVRQLQHSGAATTTGAALTRGTAAGATGTAGGAQSHTVPARSGASGSASTSALPAASSADQASFISQVWPQASRCAAQLGVHPVSLVAQAALETNWGRSVPHSATGTSSNNLFGIKAGSTWSGPAVSARTQEFTSGGAATTEAASFRSYATAGESFEDYVKLLRSNPRFSGALGSGSNVTAFASALQRGGYATDPDYAQKVTAVANQVVASLGRGGASSATALKLASALPITAGTGTL
jgi:peptidoglycan hydrolase FlgJ